MDYEKKNPIIYRTAVPDDAPALLEYLRTVGGETGNLTFGAEGMPLTEEQERKFLENIQNDPYNRLFLALDGDRIVGDSSLNGSKRPRMCHRRELGISVLRDYWGQGIGTGLMERMVEFARATGAEQMTLGVRSDNERAKALYRRFGFVRCGTWPGHIKIDGKRYDVDLMVLELADQVRTVCGKPCTLIRLLGKGKGGYSYLASWEGRRAVLKQIHHEPCEYYSFGNKLDAERHDCGRLMAAGIRIPELLAIDPETERIVKEYIDGPTVLDLLRRGFSAEPYLPQVREMAAQAKAAGLNIDYYPTNFLVQDGLLWYVDYECNAYADEWSFENWGLKYWTRTPELEAVLRKPRP